MTRLLGAAALLCVLTLAPGTARAMRNDPNAFSLGLVLGEPSGFTLRSGLGDGGAIQAHLGIDRFHGDDLSANVDYTYDVVDLMRSARGASLLFYLGVGGQAELLGHGYHEYDHDRGHYHDHDHLALGMRGLAGLRLSFRPPFDLFLEVAPVGLMLDVADGHAYYDVDVALGARIRF